MLSRKIIVIAVLVIVLAFGASLYGAQLFRARVPGEFTDARLQGALISQNIVDLSNQLTQELNRVNEYDRQAQYNQALELTTGLIASSTAIRSEAIELSKHLEIMARTLPSIKSDEARQEALEAVTNQLALINRLINYSNYLSDLLNDLRTRFEGSASKDQRVATLIEQINGEVNTINTFNRQAVEAMERFDAVINK